MDLSKPRWDFGLYTNDLDAVLAFWRDEVGAAFDGLLTMGPGRVQHRHHLNNSVFKVNHYEAPLEPAAPSGYAELLVAKAGLTAPKALADPDGNRLTLVPAGWSGVRELGLKVRANDPEAHHRFYVGALGMTPGDGGYRLGESLILVEKAETPVLDAPMSAKGYRYITLGVADCGAAHAGALAAGAREASPVRSFGETVRFSIIRDPDGNWVELTQRV